VVVDMPFLTYQVTVERAVLNAGRVMQETRCDAVKLEGGSPEIADTVRALGRAGIPVMGHLGFTPQSVHLLGGFRVQGRDEAGRGAPGRRGAPARGGRGVRRGARTRPGGRGRARREAVSIPTIGIGAGVECDGQVLVLQDLLGSPTPSRPSSSSATRRSPGDVRGAVGAFAAEVRGGAYPAPSTSSAATPDDARMLTVTTVADAARRAGRAARVGAPARRGARRVRARRWGSSTRATSRSSTRRGARRRGGDEHLRQSAAVRAARGPRALPARPGGDAAKARARGVDLLFVPDARECTRASRACASFPRRWPSAGRARSAPATSPAC
jgi:hypothetical protein